MKRLLHRAAALLCAALLLCARCAAPARADGSADGSFHILTSFYPIYALTINIAGGIDGVAVENMAQQSVGCLHDYTLRTGDMRMISAADVIVINGAGMESFADKLFGELGKQVIDSSTGIELIGGDTDHAEAAHDHDESGDDHTETDRDHAESSDDHTEADHDHAESGDDHTDADTDHNMDDGDHTEAGHSHTAEGNSDAASTHHTHSHDHGDEVNAHIWMSPRQAIKQVQNITDGLCEFDPAHAEAYRSNAAAYIDRLWELDRQVDELLRPVRGARIVTSHPAFEYLARDYGIEITASLGQEPGELPRTRDMARLVDTVRDMRISAVFVEKAYNERAAWVLSRETGISVYTLDSLTSGELTATAYEEGVLEDARILAEALTNGDT